MQMETDEVVDENPWPQLKDRLVGVLKRYEVHSFLDCLGDKIPRNKKDEILEQEHRDIQIRQFVDYLSDTCTESGFLKLMIKVSKDKHLRIRTVPSDAQQAPIIKLSEYLEQFKEKWEKYQEACRKKGMLDGCSFVAREKESDDLKQLLFRNGTKVVGTWLSGMGGTGKTTLTNRVCGLQSGHKKLYVELKSAKTVDEFYKRLSVPLNVPPPQQDQKICWETIYEEIEKLKRDVILVLDSFESLLNPGNRNKDVIEILRRILSIQNSKVKLLITSVHGLDDCMHLEDHDPSVDMKHYELPSLTMEECHKLIKRVAPKIFYPSNQEDIDFCQSNQEDIDFIVSKMCNYNTLAIQVVFNFLNENITLQEFKNSKASMRIADELNSQSSQVSDTLVRVFQGQPEGIKSALIKLSVCNGLPVDKSIASYLLGEKGPDPFTAKCYLKKLSELHLLQMDVNPNTEQNIYDSDDTRFFLHSMLQDVLERLRDDKRFQHYLETAKSKLSACFVGKLLDDSAHGAQSVIAEVQPLVTQYCKVPEIDTKKIDSYMQASKFHAALQKFLNGTELQKFYENEVELAEKNEKTLKWISLKLSLVHVLLRRSLSSVEDIESELHEVEEKLNYFKKYYGSGKLRAIELTKAEFDLANGKFHAMRRNFDEGIKACKEALSVYRHEENKTGFRRQAALAHSTIAYIYSLKGRQDSHAIDQALRHYKEAFEELGETAIYYEQIVYAMNVGVSAYFRGQNERGKIKDAEKKKQKKKAEEYRSKMKDYFEEASEYYKKSQDLCGKLKMTKSLDYIELLRNKAMLLAVSDDISKNKEAVNLAEESYKLLQEYDKSDMVQMAKCCLSIATAKQELGEKMFKAAKSNENEEAYKVMEEAVEKYEEGFKYRKKGGIMADTDDYQGWRRNYRLAMKATGVSQAEIDKKSRGVEFYVVDSIQERQTNDATPRTRKQGTTARQQSADSEMPSAQTAKPTLPRASRKRHSVPDSGNYNPKRRNSVQTDPPQPRVDVSHAVGSNKRFPLERKYSLSDDMLVMSLGKQPQQPMETAIKEENKEIPSAFDASVAKVQDEEKKMDTLDVKNRPHDADNRSSDSDSILTGYTKSRSYFSDSSVEMDENARRLSPRRPIHQKTSHANASLSFGPIPNIVVTDEARSDSPLTVPFENYGTASPKSKVKKWLGDQHGVNPGSLMAPKQKSRPLSPSGSGSSEESFHSAMDVQ